jgi:hypothetical protein
MNSRVVESPANSAFAPITQFESRFVAGIIALVVLLTTLPYLLAYSVNGTFVGQIYNIVDFSVYLSWARQAADGHFSTLNLFTTTPQHGYLFNALFLVIGAIVRLTHLPIPLVFQLFRIVGAVLLLWIAFLLCRVVYSSSQQARLTAFGFIALSSGFGFIYWPHWADNNAGHFSVDVWQPEAFTFLSTYTSFLFVVASVFILTAFYNLIRGEMTGKLLYGVNAGVCGLILGNIHSYDVLHIAAAWGFYVIAITAIERRFDKGRWLRALTSGALTLPSTLYQYWVFRHETVFRLRAMTPTLSPPLFYYAIGYGLVFFLALSTVILVALNNKKLIELFRSREVLVWIVSWAIAGLTIIYLPVAFQRKMVMGEQIPLCILSGGLTAYLVGFIGVRLRPAILTLIVAVTFPTNALFLLRDYHHIVYNKSEIPGANPFLTVQQVDVLTWLRNNTRPGEAVLALPPIGQFVPGYADRPVWVGHWSETPQYGTKISELVRILYANTPDAIRERFIDQTQTTYLVYPHSLSFEPLITKHGPVQMIDLTTNTPAYLIAVYATPVDPAASTDELASGYTIFRIAH